MPLPRLGVGTVLSGRYQLVDVIGESDVSTVYTATDQRGHTQVALKVFDPAVKARAAALSEYQAQARQASGLGVEGIARAYDFGIDANSGSPFSTAERIGWVSLDRRVLAQGPLGIADLSRAFSVLARALTAAHAARLLHRDLKPQNIFISPQNPEWVRITDFGMNAVRRGAPEAMGWGGPPGYTPPDAVDAAAPGSTSVDLFALGMIAFFALTRATPFRSLRSSSFDPNAHWSELNQPLHPISERAKEVGVALDPGLDAWFARALAVQPQDRFRTAAEMVAELTALADQHSARGGGGPRSMPGIAAAIAQPLVFQSEPSLASLASAPTAPITTAAMAAIAAAEAPSASPVQASLDEPAGVPKKGAALPLLLGLGVVLVSGLALAGYFVLGKNGDPRATASAVSPSTPPPSVAATVAPAPSVTSTAAKARFTCQPEPCEWVVCDGKNVTEPGADVELASGNHECSASRTGFASKAVAFAAVPGQVSPILFELSPLPPTTPKGIGSGSSAPRAAAAAPASKPAAAAPASKPTAAAATSRPSLAASAKPTGLKAAAPASAKPALSAKPKKKCSAFLGCK